MDIVHRVMDFNLLALALFTLYNFDESDAKKQVAAQAVIAWISTIVTIIVIIVILAYHAALLIIKYKTKKRAGQRYLTPLIQSSRSRVRYSRICEIKR